MDIKDIVARAKKAREYEFQNGSARRYKLRLPSEHEARVAYFLYAKEGEERVAGWAQSQRYLLEHALIGWEGVLVTDILPDAAAPLPIAFHADMVPILLDALDDDATALANDMADRLKARQDRLGDAEKN